MAKESASDLALELLLQEEEALEGRNHLAPGPCPSDCQWCALSDGPI